MDLAEVTERESSHTGTDSTTLISIIESTGDDEALKLLSSGRTFSQGELDTALISACQCGYKFLVYELVRLGANAQTRDKNGNTPLLICAENGFTNKAKFFIRRKVEINETNYCGNTALILASGRSGSVEMVKLLLAQTGINVNYQNKEGYTALMKAIEAMDIDIIKLLIDAQENSAEILAKIKNCRNETAQDIANMLGIGKVVKLLAEPECEPIMETVRDCDVESFNVLMYCQIYDSSKMQGIVNTAFKEIIRKHEQSNVTFNADEEKIIQRLLEHGTNVNDPYYSLDPVFIATRAGSYRVLQLLLKHVAYFDSSTRSRYKDPFKAAAENGRIDLIQLLLKHSSISKLQYSHIECALTNGHTDCARFILRQGLIVDMKTVLRSAVASQLPLHVKFLVENFQSNLQQFAHTKEMDNLLVSASKYGNVEIIGLLLDAGANVNCVSNDKKTPLMESKNAEVVYYLVKRGAVVNKYSRAKQGVSSPLTYILSQNYGYSMSDVKEAIVEALLKCGAHVDGKTCGGRTPLMIAVSNRKSRNIVQMLLDHGAQSNMTGNNGNTLLLLAAEKNKTDNILCLLQFSKYNKDNLNAQNYDGLTALIVASQNCNLEVVKHLVDHGTDVNITDVSGNTALLHAVANVDNKEEEILTRLISAGSNVNYQNHDGYSPLMLAAQKCKPNLIKLLINLGADVNSVSQTVRNRTALTVLPCQSYVGRETLECMTYLLDHGARASYVSPDVLHKLILDSKTQFVTKLIQCGLGPSEVSFSNLTHYSLIAYNPSIVPIVSPLCMALITRNVSLARYFIGNLFMTKSDTHKLASDQALRHHLCNTECLGLLDEISAQPMSLFTLVFVEVQSAVGSTPGREERIRMLPLPQPMKDRLLFKNENVKLDDTSTGQSNYSYHAFQNYLGLLGRPRLN